MREEVEHVIRANFIGHDGRWNWSSGQLESARQIARSSPSVKDRLIVWLRQTYPEYDLRDLTDLVEDQCFGVELLLHRGVQWGIWEAGSEARLIEQMGGSYRSVNIFISILLPLYYLCCYEVFPRKVDVFDCNDTPESQRVVMGVDQWLRSHGYQPISLDEANEQVPGATSDIFDEDEITVFKCLFGEVYKP